jgi:hypothetical protein
MGKVYYFKEGESSVDFKIAGMESKPDFVIGTRVEKEAYRNILHDEIIKQLLNTNLQLANYVGKDKIKSLYFTYVIYPPSWKGIQWTDAKYYKRKLKHYYIDIRFPDYERFCKAEKQEVLEIMAEQTLRGAKLFLSKVKGFDFAKFYKDLEQVFIDSGYIKKN